MLFRICRKIARARSGGMTSLAFDVRWQSESADVSWQRLIAAPSYPSVPGIPGAFR
jgi:hypothetical protein